MRIHPILKKLYGFKVTKGQLGIVWLGQNGFLLRSNSCTFLFDPYLSDFAEQWTFGWKNEHIRMSAIPIQPKELFGINFVLCTHDHVDHIDPFTIPILTLRNPETKFIAPAVAKIRMIGLFVQESNLYLMRGLDSLKLGPFSVSSIPAAHSNLNYTKEHGYPNLSYIVEVNDITIFFAGDTIPYPEQVEYVKPFQIDLAFLPINGQQAPELKCEPNFNMKEAIEFAETINAKNVIPMHYNMYTLNSANIAEFVLRANKRINYIITQLGVPFVLDF